MVKEAPIAVNWDKSIEPTLELATAKEPLTVVKLLAEREPILARETSLAEDNWSKLTSTFSLLSVIDKRVTTSCKPELITSISALLLISKVSNLKTLIPLREVILVSEMITDSAEVIPETKPIVPKAGKVTNCKEPTVVNWAKLREDKIVALVISKVPEINCNDGALILTTWIALSIFKSP